jgi:hypothetical protein
MVMYDVRAMDVKIDGQYGENKSIRVIDFTEMNHRNGSNECDPCHLRKLWFRCEYSQYSGKWLHFRGSVAS